MKNKVFNIILLIIWLIIIFFFSSDTGDISSNKSSKLSNVVSIFCKTDECKNKSEFVIRKCAHFTEYLILALLIINVMKDYKTINYKLLLLTLILCLLYASSDEWHQTFVDGRVGSYKDVLLDTCGSLIGIIIYKLIKKNK